MHKDNEFILDGKLFIRKIRTVSVIRREGNAYLIRAGIHERGEKEYLYEADTGRIRKPYTDPEKVLWLSEEAEETIRTSAAVFEEEIRLFDEEAPISAELMDGKGKLFFRNDSGKTYALRTEYLFNGQLFRTRVLRGLDPQKLIKEFWDLAYKLEMKWEDPAVHPKDREELEKSPLFLAAERSGDILLKRMTVLYHQVLLTREEAEWLSAELGSRVLPSLPAEFDRDYYVDAKTIPEGALEGYRMLHRPYFAMRGSTHGVYTLNPNQRNGVDAASKGETQVISFTDYLKLFDEAG